MNLLRFKDLENRYTIELSKKLKNLYYNDFSKYEIHIKFIDDMNNTVLDILLNELSYLKLIQDLNEFNINYGEIISNIFHLGYNTSTLNKYLIYIGNIDENYNDIDENKLNLYINILEQSLYGNKSRLYFKLNNTYLDELIYKLYTLIEDINNINEINMYLLQLPCDYFI